MKIKMLKEAKGSTNGLNVITFYEGKEYEGVPQALIESFFEMGVAEIVEAEKPKAKPKKKASKKKLENKAVKSTEENKGDN